MDTAVRPQEQPGEECLVQLPTLLRCLADVHLLAVFQQSKRHLQPFLSQSVLARTLGYEPFCFVNLCADGCFPLCHTGSCRLALPEIGNRDGVSQMGIDEFASGLRVGEAVRTVLSECLSPRTLPTQVRRTQSGVCPRSAPVRERPWPSASPPSVQPGRRSGRAGCRCRRVRGGGPWHSTVPTCARSCPSSSRDRCRPRRQSQRRRARRSCPLAPGGDVDNASGDDTATADGTATTRVSDSGPGSSGCSRRRSRRRTR